MPENKDQVKRLVDKLEDTERDQLNKYKENPDLEAHDKKVLD